MKLVKEILYEKFSDESDPIKDMGIGMRHKIEEWIELDTEIKSHIHYYVITGDGKINAKEVDISYTRLHLLPSYIRFGTIKNKFCCHFNNKKEIQQLPEYVGGYLKIFVLKKPNFTIKDIIDICNVNPENIEIVLHDPIHHIYTTINLEK